MKLLFTIIAVLLLENSFSQELNLNGRNEVIIKDGTSGNITKTYSFKTSYAGMLTLGVKGSTGNCARGMDHTKYILESDGKKSFMFNEQKSEVLLDADKIYILKYKLLNTYTEKGCQRNFFFTLNFKPDLASNKCVENWKKEFQSEKSLHLKEIYENDRLCSYTVRERLKTFEVILLKNKTDSLFEKYPALRKVCEAVPLDAINKRWSICKKGSLYKYTKSKNENISKVDFK